MRLSGYVLNSALSSNSSHLPLAPAMAGTPLRGLLPIRTPLMGITLVHATWMHLPLDPIAIC